LERYKKVEKGGLAKVREGRKGTGRKEKGRVGKVEKVGKVEEVREA